MASEYFERAVELFERLSPEEQEHIIERVKELIEQRKSKSDGGAA